MQRQRTHQESTTLKTSFRKKYGLKKGDVVVFEDREEGLLVSPREALAMELLDDIGAALKAKGITLEEMIESGPRSGRRFTTRSTPAAQMIRVFLDTSVLFAALYSPSAT